ncbi:MAG TPA: hypothetical protein VMT00_13895 [Thermoanaerobaculia bacterium]|nr:hypothetical protein [Thermoanaerobaculia bacterium]
MRSPLLTLFAVLILVAMTSCKAKEMLEEASISRDLAKKGTTDLLKEVADDEYTPPADGRLTESQIQMYLKVREHEKEIARVARKEMEQHAKAAEKSGEKSLSGMMAGFKALGSIADFATADIRAAKELGYNTQEYLWIKGQVLAASTSEMTQQMAKASSAWIDSSHQQLKKQHEEATDPQLRKMYADMLAGLDQQKTEMQPEAEDPTIAYNRLLLSKYENALDALTSELAKYEATEGEAKEGMKKFEDELAKSAEEAAAK